MSAPVPSLWMIGTKQLVWDRSIMGFVPMSLLHGTSMKTPLDAEEVDRRFNFHSEEAVVAQAKELQSMGVEVVVHRYAKVHEGSK